MSHTLPHLLTDLPRDQTLRIADGQAHVIAVFEGQVWLTQDGDLRDVFLEAGDSFSFDSRGLTLVQALRDARLLVSDRVALDRAQGLDADSLHRQARVLRDAAIAALVRRGWSRAGSALRRAAAALSHRPLRPSGTGAAASHAFN